MNINIIYVIEKMSFKLDTHTHHLGPGVYGMASGHVQYLYHDTDITVEQAQELAERKMEIPTNG